MIEASENISIVKVGALWEYLGALIKEQKIWEMPINKAFPILKNHGDGGIPTGGSAAFQAGLRRRRVTGMSASVALRTPPSAFESSKQISAQKRHMLSHVPFPSGDGGIRSPSLSKKASKKGGLRGIAFQLEPKVEPRVL